MGEVIENAAFEPMTENVGVSEPETPQAPAKKKKKSKKTQLRRLFEDIVYLILKIAVVVCGIMVVMIYVFGITIVTDESMYPAVKDGDLVVYYRLDKNYVAQDTTIVRFEGVTQVRRVIAVAGDVVDITEKGLSINGHLQQEASIYEDTLLYVQGIEFPITVGDGQVFVLGDARTSAVDSRIYGCVDIEDTLGKAFAVIRKRGI